MDIRDVPLVEGLYLSNTIRILEREAEKASNNMPGMELADIVYGGK